MPCWTLRVCVCVCVYIVFREARWDFLEKKEKDKNEKIAERVGQCSPTFPVASLIFEACKVTLALSRA